VTMHYATVRIHHGGPLKQNPFGIEPGSGTAGKPEQPQIPGQPTASQTVQHQMQGELCGMLRLVKRVSPCQPWRRGRSSARSTGTSVPSSVSRKAARFRSALFAAVTATDFRAIVVRVVQEAKAGESGTAVPGGINSEEVSSSRTDINSRPFTTQPRAPSSPRFMPWRRKGRLTGNSSKKQSRKWA